MSQAGTWSMPFTMFDLTNYQLITTATIPEGNIRDTKQIVISETPIPGRNFQPIAQGGQGNRKISFTLPIVKRNDIFGNLTMLKQFDGLRNQASGGFGGIQAFTGGTTKANPKVLFQWGTGSIPLVWYVTKCDFTHMAGMVNAAAYPQHTLVDIELTLDEENILYRGEEMFRSVTSILGNMNVLGNVLPNNQRGRSLLTLGSVF